MIFMSQLKLNIIANYTGKAWTALMSLAFIPLYIKFIGIEAYGLIGFFVYFLIRCTNTRSSYKQF